MIFNEILTREFSVIDSSNFHFMHTQKKRIKNSSKHLHLSLDFKNAFKWKTQNVHMEAATLYIYLAGGTCASDKINRYISLSSSLSCDRESCNENHDFCWHKKKLFSPH